MASRSAPPAGGIDRAGSAHSARGVSRAGSAHRARGALAVLAGVLLLGGCTQAKAPGTGGDASSTSASASTSAPSSASTSAARPSATATAKGEPSLGGRCEDLLSVGAVNIALRRTVIGRTAFVLGVAEPDIGRLTYLNCRYGLSAPVKGKPAPQPQVEIGVSLYESAAQAARRVQATVENYRLNGAGDRPARVGSARGTMLSGYGLPTLVVADGPRTVAVTVTPKLLTPGSTAELASLAKAVLDATAGYTGVGPAASASPSGTG
ncbi:MAG TPA: hypothetical protein VGB75_19015 [Jatrophihabitans sp.]|uniref:hypothetical protein n=1 Tax=Jatrophihabitans sp. TaxID=1932789 RepID=UPI002F0BCFEF